MVSIKPNTFIRRDASFDGHWRDGSSREGLIVEAWGQGFMIGALIVMACITVAAMRKNVLLHKMILLEQVLAMFHGTFCFMSFNGYGWYVSATATLLYCSYFVHNVVAWIKVLPFFVGRQPFFDEKTGKIVRWVYISSLACTAPALIFEGVNNFRFNNNINSLYTRVRPYEFLVKDPWWLFTNIVLLHIIARTYGVSIFSLVRNSPRLGILLCAVFLAIGFTTVDIVATIVQGALGHVEGINPYWKLSLVFKCLTDAIMLDDFATELKRLGMRRMQRDQPSQKRQSSSTVKNQSGLDQALTIDFSNGKIEALKVPEKVKRQLSDEGCFLEIEHIA